MRPMVHRGVCVLGLGAALAGCGAHHDPRPGGGKEVQVLDPELDRAARAILDGSCVGCHGAAGAGFGGFATADDTKAMIAAGALVVGSPDQSPLFRRIADRTMPPGAPLSAADVAVVRQWIAVGLGAPPPAATPTPAPDGVVIKDPALHQSALALFERHCAGCHGVASPGYGGFRSVLDVDAMAGKGLLAPGDPASSTLYARSTDGTMPPGTGLTPEQQQLIHDWIAHALE